VFIELTDHLRCPADHDEQFLVLLPGTMTDRSVRSGDLGCPVCGREFHISNGVLDFGGGPEAEPEPTALDADAAVALAGVTGPGGYVALVGGAAANHGNLSPLLEGVSLVAVNPPRDVAADGSRLSVLRAPMLPLKAGSMRAVLLGPGYGSDSRWVRDAARVVLPGLRVVGEGPAPAANELELLASVEGCWVGARPAGRF
jgi:uncharacterized protein YbaR (Trm112 family)